MDKIMFKVYEILEIKEWKWMHIVIEWTPFVQFMQHSGPELLLLWAVNKAL